MSARVRARKGGGRIRNHKQRQGKRAARAGADAEKACDRGYSCVRLPHPPRPTLRLLPCLLLFPFSPPPVLHPRHVSVHAQRCLPPLVGPLPQPTDPSLSLTMPPSCSASTSSYLSPQQNRLIPSIVCLRLPFLTTRGPTTSRAWAASHTRMKYTMAATRCAAKHLLSHSLHRPLSFPPDLPAFPASLEVQPTNPAPAPPPPPDHPHAGSCLRRFRVQSARIRARDPARHERGRGLGPKTCGRIAAREQTHVRARARACNAGERYARVNWRGTSERLQWPDGGEGG